MSQPTTRKPAPATQPKVAAAKTALAVALPAKPIVKSAPFYIDDRSDEDSTQNGSGASLAMNILGAVVKSAAPKSAVTSKSANGAQNALNAMSSLGQVLSSANAIVGEVKSIAADARKASNIVKKAVAASKISETLQEESDPFGPYEPPAEGEEGKANGRKEANGKDGTDGTECPICLCPIRQARLMPCGHAICAACLAHLFIKTPKVGCCKYHAKPGTPKCPTCRAAIHPSICIPCPALDSAIEKLYPADPADKSTLDAPTAEDTDMTIADLRALEAAQSEQRIAAAVRWVWAEVKRNIATSDAVLLSELTVPKLASTGMTGGMAERVAATMGGLFAPPEQDSDGDSDVGNDDIRTDLPAQQSDVWYTIWKYSGEVGKRLRAAGLEVKYFTIHGVQRALITWP